MKIGTSKAGRVMEVPGNGESVEKFSPDGELSSNEVPEMFVKGDVGGVKYVVPTVVP